MVLKGLTGNPLLAPMTTENLFSSVPEISSSAGPIVRSLTGGRPPASAFSDAAIVRSARVAESAVGSVFPGDQTRMAALTRQVLTSESADLNADQRAQVAGVVTAAFGQLRHLISLPGASSITLTARDGGVPITVVANGAAGANVQLRLSSDKLSFRPFLPPGGHCVTPSAGVELCNLTLSSEATTLTVPVVARTSGVFSLDVSLSTPDGKISLSDTSDTVRSTAFSGVGVVLIVVAGFGLAYWWIRNIRHGRRARDLVPAGSGTRGDTDDDIYYDLDGDHLYRGHFEGGHTWSDDEDRMIAEFFSSPPPVYPPPPSQPDLPGR